jgi:cytochrome c556
MRSRAAALVVVAAAACAGREPATPGDPRTAVALPADANLAVRAEMRAMLGALSGILAGLANNDTAAIRVAAHPAGMGEAADPAIERLLPERWMELAAATHQGFDGVAEAAGAGAPPDSVTRRLATVLTNCLACHATYRLGP